MATMFKWFAYVALYANFPALFLLSMGLLK